MKAPCTNKPCKDCPFRKDSLKGWLGAERVKEILEADSFVCHKKTDLQCSGHMLVKKEANSFYKLMTHHGIENQISGSELVFDNEQEVIDHHDFKNI